MRYTWLFLFCFACAPAANEQPPGPGGTTGVPSNTGMDPVDDDEDDMNDMDDDDEMMMVVTGVGADGGTVAAGGASVTIPAGALSSNVSIGVASVSAPVAIPAGLEAVSNVFELTPHGQPFAAPVMISLPFSGPAETVLRLSDASDTTWEPVTVDTFGASSVSLASNTFSFYVVVRALVTAPAVQPFYANAPNWNDYTKPDGSACFNFSNPLILTNRECHHGGERKRVVVAGHATCDGLAASDALNAFDWRCVVESGAANMVTSALREDAGMFTLIDFDTPAWKPNSVTVTHDGMPLFTTASAVWWANTVENANAGVVAASGPGKVFVVTNDSEETYEISDAKQSLVVQPGHVIAPRDTGSNPRVFWYGPQGWFEGEIRGSGSDNVGIVFNSGAQGSVARKVRVSGHYVQGMTLTHLMRAEQLQVTCEGSNPGGATDLGVSLAGNGLAVRDVRVSKCWNGINAAGALSVMSGLTVDGGAIHDIGANTTIVDALVHHAPIDGISTGTNTGNLVMFATTMHNLGHGMRVDGFTSTEGVSNSAISVIASENRQAGFRLTTRLIGTDVVSFANTLYGFSFVTGGKDNAFFGALSVGFNGASMGNYYSGDPGGCMVGTSPADCYNSRSSTASGNVNGLLTLSGGTCALDTNSTAIGFNPPVRGTDHPMPIRANTDSVNADESPDGNALYANITDWQGFETRYRGWGVEGSGTPSCNSQGPCLSGTCQVFDYRMRYDTYFINGRGTLPPTGNEVWHHDFSIGPYYTELTEAACPLLYPGAEVVVAGPWKVCRTTFLARAREVHGNGNGLCESNETCVWAPAIGAFQGEGALEPIPAFAFVDGTISGVTLVQHATQTVDLPHRP